MRRYAALVPLLSLVWGLNWPVVRICLDEIPPWTLRTLGFGLAAILMFLLIRLRGGSARVPRRQWWRVALVGILSGAAFNMFTAFAQLSGTTSRSAVLAYTTPVWTVLFARLLLGEPLDWRRWAGLSLGGLGLVALGWPLVVAGQLSWGYLLAIMAAVSWAAGNVALKLYPIDADALVITAWQLALSGVATGIGMLALEGLPSLHPLQLRTTLALIHHIVLAQALGTTLWFTLLGALPAGIAAIGSLLVPAVGVLGAALLLGEHPTLPDWIGLALVVAASASVLVRLSPADAKPVPTAARA